MTDYTYGAVGNRLTKTGVTGGYAYDAADRMTSAGGVSYTWDDNGNLTARGSDSFAWDVEDRLTSATVSSVTTTFAYNGDGLRESLKTSGNTTTFTWDVNRSIPQVLDDEDFRYVYGIGRIAQVSGSATHYYLPDGLGSTMALVDADGDVVNDYDYDVFGALRDSSGSQDNEFTFAGEQVDGTGLRYLRARYYDMAVGRFLATDPFGVPSVAVNSESIRLRQKSRTTRTHTTTGTPMQVSRPVVSKPSADSHLARNSETDKDSTRTVALG